jgi:hypothetical protein
LNVDAQELKGIADLHHPDRAYNGKYCQACGPEYGRWPCDARALLDEVNALAARLALMEPIVAASVAWADNLFLTDAGVVDLDRNLRDAVRDYLAAGEGRADE